MRSCGHGAGRPARACVSERDVRKKILAAELSAPARIPTVCSSACTASSRGRTFALLTVEDHRLPQPLRPGGEKDLIVIAERLAGLGLPSRALGVHTADAGLGEGESFDYGVKVKKPRVRHSADREIRRDSSDFANR